MSAVQSELSGELRGELSSSSADRGTERWARAIRLVFARHARTLPGPGGGEDGSVIGAQALGDLFVEVLGLVESSAGWVVRPSADELSRFVAFMDQSKDGWISEQEFINFCIQGLRQSPQQHEAFSRRSPMHAQLIKFINAIDSVSRKDVKDWGLRETDGEGAVESTTSSITTTDMAPATTVGADAPATTVAATTVGADQRSKSGADTTPASPPPPPLARDSIGSSARELIGQFSRSDTPGRKFIDSPLSRDSIGSFSDAGFSDVGTPARESIGQFSRSDTPGRESVASPPSVRSSALFDDERVSPPSLPSPSTVPVAPENVPRPEVFPKIGTVAAVTATANGTSSAPVQGMGAAEATMRRLFAEFDVDVSGELDKYEFRNGMRTRLGMMNVPTKAIDELFDFYDADDSGGIDVEEFISKVLPDYKRKIKKELDAAAPALIATAPALETSKVSRLPDAANAADDASTTANAETIPGAPPAAFLSSAKPKTHSASLLPTPTPPPSPAAAVEHNPLPQLSISPPRASGPRKNIHMKVGSSGAFDTHRPSVPLMIVSSTPPTQNAKTAAHEIMIEDVGTVDLALPAEDDISTKADVALRFSGKPLAMLSVKEAVRDANKRMSAGWTALHYTCPVSGLPLLRSPDGTKVWSSRCQCCVVTQAQYDFIVARPLPPEEDVLAKVEAVRLKPCLPLLTLEEAVRNANERMSTGWTALHYTCPVSGLPLLRSPDGTKVWSSRCQCWVVTDANMIRTAKTDDAVEALSTEEAETASLSDMAVATETGEEENFESAPRHEKPPTPKNKRLSPLQRRRRRSSISLLAGKRNVFEPKLIGDRRPQSALPSAAAALPDTAARISAIQKKVPPPLPPPALPLASVHAVSPHSHSHPHCSSASATNAPTTPTSLQESANQKDRRRRRRASILRIRGAKSEFSPVRLDPAVHPNPPNTPPLVPTEHHNKGTVGPPATDKPQLKDETQGVTPVAALVPKGVTPKRYTIKARILVGPTSSLPLDAVLLVAPKIRNKNDANKLRC